MYYYSDKIMKRLDEIATTVYSDSLPVHDFFVKKGSDASDATSSLDSGWRKAKDTDAWGGYAQYQWFRTSLKIPAEWKGKKVALYVATPGDISWKVSSEYSAYINGKFVGGLDVFHHEILLENSAKGSEKYELAMMAFSGYNTRKPTIECKLVTINKTVRDFYYNLKVAYEVTQYSNQPDCPEILEVMDIVNKTVCMIDFRVLGSPEYFASIKKANEFITNSIYKKMHSRSQISVSAIGHSHIDVAWLWRLKQTQDKAARTLGSVDRLMKEFPDFKFIQSQPQLYAYTKDLYPDLYERIKKHVKEGRIEPEGGMWVEADCNLISGESMIRQFLVGKRFFKDEFGIDDKILWLPDVFGYSAAMPQILQGCGIKYFMTTKISWNQFNRMPMDTFWLQGIDGSKVLTHFITTPIQQKDSKESHKLLPFHKTYNGVLCAETVSHNWNTYQQKEANSDLLMAFGYGDGGGGPTAEMLENGKRLADFPTVPKVKWVMPSEYFEKLEKQVKSKDLPTWVGELYLEFHRGTYTSIAKNKRYNRKSEFLYQNIEALSTIAEVLNGYTYPLQKLQDSWKVILLNQFHDIIPGSAISEVYIDSWAQYESLTKDGNKMQGDAVQNLVSKIPCSEESVVVFNPNSAFKDSLVTANFNKKVVGITDESGNVFPVQTLSDGNSVFFAKDVPQYGYKTFATLKSPTQVQSQLSVTKTKMENKFFSITLDEKGEITGIYDKRYKRNVMPKGTKANVLLSFEDKPINYNNWDIDIFYTEKCWPVNDVQKIFVKETGTVMGVLSIKRKYLQSTIEQDICIYNDIPRIDFKTVIDWKQQEILLKAAFPVDVNSTRATYEIQYGAVERNTHQNTSWDVAKFETCGHKWVDLSQNDWGVSLMNDCKYGHDIHGNTIRLTLLKSGIDPNPNADKDIHQFTYSLYPHDGTWVDAKTTNMAYELNNPMIAKLTGAHKGELPSNVSFASMDNDNIIISTVKKAEVENAYIVRMYECANTSAHGTITFGKNIESMVECNMIEEGGKNVAFNTNKAVLKFRPFEIKTLKITFKK